MIFACFALSLKIFFFFHMWIEWLSWRMLFIDFRWNHLRWAINHLTAHINAQRRAPAYLSSESGQEIRICTSHSITPVPFLRVPFSEPGLPEVTGPLLSPGKQMRSLLLTSSCQRPLVAAKTLPDTEIAHWSVFLSGNRCPLLLWRFPVLLFKSSFALPYLSITSTSAAELLRKVSPSPGLMACILTAA